MLYLQGLVQVFEEMIPRVEHIFYLKYLYVNCKKAYGGGTLLRDLILSIAKATYVEEWKRSMKQLESTKNECYGKLAALPPTIWTKSHFSFYSKIDMLINNISKAFNGMILEARDQHILIMFEWIRCYWMERFAEKRKKGEKYIGKILLKPKKRLDGQVVKCRNWTSKWAGELKFEVTHNNRHIHEKFMVDLENGSCSCRF